MPIQIAFLLGGLFFVVVVSVVVEVVVGVVEVVVGVVETLELVEPPNKMRNKFFQKDKKPIITPP